jgi:two-component system sensor histidine kinase DegS
MDPTGMNEDSDQSENETEKIRLVIAEQHDLTLQELREIDMLLEQSELEVNRLTQRNASATGNLQRIHMQFDSLPREEIRTAYEAALESQQRLFVMRGQVEKLQSDQSRLKHLVELQVTFLKHLDEEQPTSPRKRSPKATVELLETMINAQEAERQRLSRQMHDGPAQALSNLILETEIAMRLFDIDKAKAYEELGNLKESATSTFQQVRDFIFELRPMMLDDLGLVPTLKKYCSAVKDQYHLDVRLIINGTERRLESYLEVLIFRAIQELLGNAYEHSQASLVKIQMDMLETDVRIVVEDNGSGFNTTNLEEEKGMGLKVIKDRVEMLGGKFGIESQIGGGTRVSFQVPAAIIIFNE